MLTIIERLENWRKERGLDLSQGFSFDLNTQVSFIFEEIGVEYLRATNEEEQIDALCDTVVFCVNGASLLGYNALGYKVSTSNDITINMILQNTVNLLSHQDVEGFGLICSKCVNMIQKMGYDFEKCMDETLKEIESRKGDFNPDSGKWEKFKDEESKKLWYKADYSKCKIKE